MSNGVPNRGWKIVLGCLVGLVIGGLFGAFAGGGLGYLYVMTPTPGQAPDSSAIAPLRESVAGLAAVLGFVLGAVGFGAFGTMIGGVTAWLRTRQPRL